MTAKAQIDPAYCKKHCCTWHTPPKGEKGRCKAYGSECPNNAAAKKKGGE